MRPYRLAVLVSAACSRPPNPTTSTLSNVGEMTIVDRDFTRRYELDYRHPLQERWFGTTAIPPVDHRELCDRGDPVACLQATMKSKMAGGVIGPIILNCRRGHDLSCRYLAWDETGYKEPYPFQLSSAELRRGCAAGIAPECETLVASGLVDDVRFGAEMSCLHAKRECIRAAQSYLHDEPRSKLRAQYYLEVDCQSSGGQACLLLSTAYHSGELDEPVPGRGKALERYVCRYDDELCPAGRRQAPN